MLEIALEHGKPVLNVLDERVTQHGLSRIPFPVDCMSDDLSALLSAAAHYYWHLNRTSADHLLSNKVEVKFMGLEDVPGEFDENFQELRLPCGQNLVENGVIRVDTDTDKIYGMKITSKVHVPLYVSVFFFDNSDFSISKRFCLQRDPRSCF